MHGARTTWRTSSRTALPAEAASFRRSAGSSICPSGVACRHRHHRDPPGLRGDHARRASAAQREAQRLEGGAPRYVGALSPPGGHGGQRGQARRRDHHHALAGHALHGPGARQEGRSGHELVGLPQISRPSPTTASSRSTVLGIRGLTKHEYSCKLIEQRHGIEWT